MAMTGHPWRFQSPLLAARTIYSSSRARWAKVFRLRREVFTWLSVRAQESWSTWIWSVISSSETVCRSSSTTRWTRTKTRYVYLPTSVSTKDPRVMSQEEKAQELEAVGTKPIFSIETRAQRARVQAATIVSLSRLIRCSATTSSSTSTSRSRTRRTLLDSTYAMPCLTSIRS